MVSKADNGFSSSIEILNRLHVHRSKRSTKLINEVGKEEGLQVNINPVRYPGRCKLNWRCLPFSSWLVIRIHLPQCR